MKNNLRFESLSWFCLSEVRSKIFRSYLDGGVLVNVVENLATIFLDNRDIPKNRVQNSQYDGGD